MFTLEDTLLGYIADDLRWCGDPSTSGKESQSLGMAQGAGKWILELGKGP